VDKFDVSDRDVQAMLHIASSHDAEETGPLLPWTVLSELRDLVGCDEVNLVDKDDVRRVYFASQSVSAYEFVRFDTPEPGNPLHWQLYWDCLPCSHPGRSGDLVSVTKVSDFYSPLAWHNTGMYTECMRPEGVEHEIMVCLPSGAAGRTLRFLFWRGKGPDFTERDRALLTLLRPHLNAAYVAAERRRLGSVSLTPRQNEILQQVATGLTNRQIARRLAVSEATVRKHLENAFARLNVASRTAAVGRAGIEPSAPAAFAVRSPE
jgi:DNA-binding CsgD family transcriptional regulator